jgi:dynein heavy chain
MAMRGRGDYASGAELAPPQYSTPPAPGAFPQSWMTGVEAEMRATLAAVLKEGVWNYAKTPRPRWIQDSLGMVTLAGSQV